MANKKFNENTTFGFQLKNYLKDLKGFKGVIVKNQYKPLKEGESIITNLSPKGTHWSGIKRSGNNILYYDSYGVPPFQKLFDVEKAKNRDIYFNKRQIQAIDSSSCGYYVVHFLKNVHDLDDYEEYIYDWEHSGKYENEQAIQKYINTLNK